MPSSTFSSEAVEISAQPRAPEGMTAKQGVIGLLVGLAAILLGLEISSPMILRLLSRTERRIASEMRDASSLRPLSADGRPTVLLAGNSLLIEGVQFDSLRADVSQQYDISRLTVEQTHYFDWYFGLRRLLQSGSHPSVIVLTLATDQLASRLTMGEAFAHRQMSTRDFPLVVRETDLDRTTASSYLFAHWSRWQADKGFIRQCISILLIPNFRELAGRIADHGPHVNDPNVILERARQRTAELGELARTYGVRIVLLVPPVLHEDYSREIQQMGDEAGVPVWVLSLPGEFPREYFRDGFHLNTTGSGIFTARLAQQLRGMQNLQASCEHCTQPAPSAKRRGENK
jgi:hypothetical protein